MQSAKGVFCVVVALVAAVGAATATEWVTVSSTVDAAATPAAPAAAADAEMPAVVAMEVAAAAAPRVRFVERDFSSLTMMEVGSESQAAADQELLAGLAEHGSLRLTEQEQDAIVTEALEILEEEFIRDYGADADRDQLEAVLRDEDQALESGNMRFAQSEVDAEAMAAAERRRRRKRGGGRAAKFAAQSARMGFMKGNTSPGGLAGAAGPGNAKKMGGGLFKRLGRGIKKFAKKAGRWLKKRFGGGQGGAPQPPAQGAGKGWMGRLFDKVKAGAGKVSGLMAKWGPKAAGWGAKLAGLGQSLGANSKLGGFLGKLGGGMQKWGTKIGAAGAAVQGWLNGQPVPPNTKGAVIQPLGQGPPPPGAPGGVGGSKILPGMPGTYKDKKGRWRGPGGRRVYSAAQQAKRQLKKAERKAAREARRAARERRHMQRQARREAKRAANLEKDKKQLAKHLEWRQQKLEEKADRMKARKNRLDYSGVDPDFPEAGWRLHTPEEIEDCVACRYVWLQVEMDVGNTAIEDNVYDAYNANALEAMKQPIFYPGVQTMYDAVDDMIGDYMDGMTVNQICENSLQCRMPEN